MIFEDLTVPGNQQRAIPRLDWRIILALLLSAVSASPAEAENCCDATTAEPSNAAAQSRETERMRVHIQSRIASADKLIADGDRLNAKTQKLMSTVDAINKLDEKVSAFPSQRIASGVTTPNAYELYDSLFKEYYQALAQYKQHRQEYNAHVNAYHQNPQPEMIAPTPTDPNASTSATFNGMRALKFQAQDKCQQLQQLESNILSNEQQLQQMISNLMASQQKESAAMFASAWSDANQLAQQNGQLASQFSHQGLQKTASVANSVHQLIELANRDGAYNAHLEAYKNLADSNNVEQELNKRMNIHGQWAMRFLGQLASMRPQNQGPSAPGADGGRVYTASDLAQENNELDKEYAHVQDLFGKLESVRQTMPKTYKPQGITK